MKTQDIINLYKQTKPDNFVSFLNAIKSARTSGNVTSIELQSALCSIIESQMQECRSCGMKGPDMTTSDRELINSSGRLIACYLMILLETRSKTELRKKVLLLLEYASYCSPNKLPLIELAAKSVSFSFSYLGYSWSMLEVCPSIEMLVHKMAESAAYNTDETFSMLKVAGAGYFTAKKGIMKMSSSSTDGGVKAFSLGRDCCEIITENAREQRLKATEADDIKSLEVFSKAFLNNQELAKRGVYVEKNRLALNASYSIRLEDDGIDDDGTKYFTCSPFGVDYEGACEIAEEELSKGITTSDIVDFLYPKDCICGATLIDKNEPPLFSIRDAYLKYAKKAATQDATSKRKYQAKVVKYYKGATLDKDRICLISDRGYGGLMRVKGNYELGELVVVYTQFTNFLGCDLYINMDTPDSYVDEEVSKFDPEDVLSDFVSTPEDAKSSDTQPGRDSKDEEANREMVLSIGRILANTKSASSIERYRHLISSSFVSNIVGDSENKNWALARAEYLGECLRVAEGLKTRNRIEDFALTEEEKRIIQILVLLSSSEDSSILGELLHGKSGTSKEKEIAQLVLVSRLSQSMPDEIKAAPDSIREKICSLLGVKDHFKSSAIHGGGKYGKGELRNVEFKSSYVMSNKTGLPDIEYQGRGQVFEAVCAFLNSEGGTVYIGVNNSGDPITDEDYGLQADINWFAKNYSSLNMQRKRQLGHPVPQPKDLDSYCLFLNDEKELYFKPNICPYITIEPTPDFDAIRISVVPSPFEIAKLYKDNTWSEGTVHYRDGGETPIMPRRLQEERLMMLRSVGKMEKFILTLTDAIDQKKKVLLKGYYSSNSNMVHDRYVVPINLVYNNENLWAYDLENKEFKEFRLSRISSIEYDMDEPVYYHRYQKETADVFRWIQPGVSYHIILKLTISALNCLREEFSNAKNLPEEELYQVDDNHWILDTKLQGWGAITRFYLGLADQIEILPSEDSQELINQIIGFRKKYIDPLAGQGVLPSNSGNTSSG